MTIKIKRMLFSKIAIILSLCFVLNNTFMMKSYAEDAVSFNPLFIPIAEVVTATAIASGIIANNTQDAIDGANQLVQNVISNIKAKEIEKSESDSSYVSPFTVIKGGKPEKPSNDNKDDKWVALGAGALASHEIWTNKEAIQTIMSEINKLNGYNKTINETGVKNVSDTNLISTANASGVALQLAQFDNRLNTQFSEVINSDSFNNWVTNNNIDKNHLVYAVCFYPPELAYKSNIYPALSVSCVDSSEFSKIGLKYKLGFNTITGNESSYKNAYSYSFYYLVNGNVFQLLNSDEQPINCPIGMFNISARDPSTSPSVTSRSTKRNIFSVKILYSSDTENAYCGFKWASDNPWNFTNNVYNTNQTFNVNFPDWLQQSLNLLGQQLDAVRLGLTSITPSWDPSQAQIQSGTSPTNVITQYINNYENPENIPDDEPKPDPDPEPTPGPAPEPVPDDEYLGSFLLPESITTKFPFCIPFDVARCLRLFSTSDREAPRWECDLGYGSSKYHVVIDLSMFNDVASFIRPLQYIVFLVGLAIGTRSLIRG